LARKRSIYSTWQLPDGHALTNQEVEDLLTAKEGELEEQEQQLELDSDENQKATHGATTKLFLVYVSMVCVRWVIEVLFLVAYFYIYVFQLWMPHTYKCDRAPCNEVVNCYIDRAEQKTIAIHVMVATSLVSIAVGFFEIFYLFTKKSGGKSEIGTAFARRHDDITQTAKQMKNDSHLKVLL